MTKNKTFLLNQSPACANYAFYVAIYACIDYAKAVKIGKLMMRRAANKHSKQDPSSRIKNKTLFSLWVFDCNVEDSLLFLIVIISIIHDFLSFHIVVSKCEEWKEEAFLWSARVTVSIATPLQWSMRWDITSLVHNVNLIRAKKSITPTGLNIFFFASIGEPRTKFLKLVLNWVSTFGWMKQVTILLFKFQSSAFIF